MNWKLIFQLSLFGLIMAFGTISLIPEKTEFIYWLVIFIFCAFVIARQCAAKQFWHGFWLSMVNSLWIFIAHGWFFKSYMAHHADMTTTNPIMNPFPQHPRAVMLLFTPIFGAAFGLLQGLFAYIVSRFVKAVPPVV
ncbi:hypothetical protein [Mucilaginibacter sp.]